MTNITQKTAQNYIELLKAKGEEQFYRHIISSGIKRTLSVNDAEIEVLNLSDAFFAYNRKIGHDNDVFLIGKILRRAAHTLYRNFLKIDKNRPKNPRFLQLV